MQFTIHGEMTDLNAYIKAINSSRYGGNSIKQYETNRVAQEVRAAKLKPVTEYPVLIAYHWYSKDARKDTDNVAFAKKYINDGLVVAGILENDGRKQVCGFFDHFFIDKEHPRVEVTIMTGVQS